MSQTSDDKPGMQFQLELMCDGNYPMNKHPLGPYAVDFPGPLDIAAKKPRSFVTIVDVMSIIAIRDFDQVSWLGLSQEEADDLESGLGTSATQTLSLITLQGGETFELGLDRKQVISIIALIIAAAEQSCVTPPPAAGST